MYLQANQHCRGEPEGGGCGLVCCLDGEVVFSLCLVIQSFSSGNHLTLCGRQHDSYYSSSLPFSIPSSLPPSLPPFLPSSVPPPSLSPSSPSLPPSLLLSLLLSLPSSLPPSLLLSLPSSLPPSLPPSIFAHRCDIRDVENAQPVAPCDGVVDDSISAQVCILCDHRGNQLVDGVALFHRDGECV